MKRTNYERCECGDQGQIRVTATDMDGTVLDLHVLCAECFRRYKLDSLLVIGSEFAAAQEPSEGKE